MSGIIVSGDTSGSVTLSAPAVAGAVTVTLPSTTGTMLTTASATGISGSAISSGTVPEAYGGTGTSTGYYGFKNRIINGAMVIDQRNAGAAVTTNDSFPVDRFKFSFSTSNGAFSAQQSTTAPTGFINSLKFTTTTADSVLAATELSILYQVVEGLNFSDFAWGTASALPVTLSFWVRSSATGTFGGALQNSAGNRSYPFTYTINAIDTWEQKSITVAGDTSGTWLTTNGAGVYVILSQGCGTTRSGTSGSWASANYLSATGAVSLMQTLNATFYITGVQLEKGSTATSFDYRPYGTELALCQRYFEVVTQGASATCLMSGVLSGTSNWLNLYYKQTKRATPTVALTATGSWNNSTPAIYPSIDQCSFNSGTAYFYNQGTINTPVLSISAEL